MKALRLPHPIVLLLGCVAIATILTWILPAGEFNRREDAATGRNVVVAGTYHAVDRAPVGPFAAAVSVPRGFVNAAEVIVVVLLAGGAFVVLEQLGVLARAVGALTSRLKGRVILAIPLVSLFFFTMGGLENMQEEIIPLVPILLVLTRSAGMNAVTAVAMSAGAAMAGSAFSPVNPFQAGIALKLAEQPATLLWQMRLVMCVAAFIIWVGWTMRYTQRNRVPAEVAVADSSAGFSLRDLVMLLAVLLPVLVYLYGTLKLGWGFNELSAGFLIGGVVAALVGGFSIAKTTSVFFEGMCALLPAAFLIAVAQSISVVLRDGHVIDTILNALATPLASAPASMATLLMIPFHMLVHVFVPSVSGQAVLTMPILVPLSDLLGFSRQATVLAYQTGAGLCEFLTPTNGSLMAILLAARVSYATWLKFAVVGVGMMVAVGVVGILFAM